MTDPAANTAAAGLDALLAGIALLPDGGFRLPGGGGEPHPSPPDRLAAELYLRAFARPWAAAPPGSSAEPSAADLARRLVEAHPGEDRWRDGWRVEQVLAGGRLVVRRNDQRREVPPGEYAPTLADSLPPRTGMGVTVLFPMSSLTLQPGTYCGFGARLPASDDAETVRLYWNAPSGLVAGLLAALVPVLDRTGVPFTFKTMLEPADRDRLDRTVLYVPRRRWAPAAAALADLPAEVWQGLGSPVPLFTLPLAPGLGLAETPRTGESFGIHRCRLLAEALAQCARRGEDDPAARRAAVERRFAEDGLRLSAPHLNPGSAPVYRELRRRRPGA